MATQYLNVSLEYRKWKCMPERIRYIFYNKETKCIFFFIKLDIIDSKNDSFSQ